MNINRLSSRSRRLATLAAVFTTVPLLVVVGIAHAATLTTASLLINDPRPYTASPLVGNSQKYDFLASGITNASTVQCVQLRFTVNSDGSGGVPTSFDSTLGSVSVNTTESTFFASHTGWTLDKATNGTLKYTHATGDTPAGAATQHFVVDGIRNGSVADNDYYLTFSTFGDDDCVTTPIDSSTVGFIYTAGQQVSLTVDGSLSFAVAGIVGTGSNTVNGANITNGVTTTATTIPFGPITASSNRVAAQDLTVSTNSGAGYTVYTKYTGVPTAGSFTISDLLTHTNASPGTFSGFGTEAFGYTTNDGSLGTGTTGRFTATGGDKWAAFSSTTNGEIAYHNGPVANQTTRVGFQAGISGTTEPGNYTTTVIYTAVPVY